MNRQQMLWGASAAALAVVAISAVLLAARPAPGGAAPPAGNTALDPAPSPSRQESSMLNAPTTPPADFRAQLEAFAAQRDTMSAAARQDGARHLIDQLRRDAQAGRIDPHGAAGLADLLWSDAEPDPAQRAARSDALREQLRDLAMPARAASPARERQDQEYAAQSRRIIAEVTAAIPDREQQRPVLELRLGALRKRIYGDDATSNGH
ncbi:phospholipase C accessory protein PlcR [Burkholderia alba]|uniref:phospholipase C accessory protein PlcR n=1 Tax=Burkholderia alba TaxID=2683677 RepID=UPI002B052BFB|nr:phospholipase C accessory protein PlcR [Burkholderia alba]